MEVVSVNEARAQFSELMAKVAYGGQRVVVERRGKPLVVWISVEELHRMEELESNPDHRRAARSRALVAAAAVRERIQIERSGTQLPDAVDVIAHLREERIDELAGVR